MFNILLRIPFTMYFKAFRNFILLHIFMLFLLVHFEMKPIQKVLLNESIPVAEKGQFERV